MATPRLRVAVLVLAFGALMDCRCRSRTDSKATAECKEAAIHESEAAATDAGSREGVAADMDRRCRACCHARGLDVVDPGYCECGDLGLDALMK